MGATTSFQKAFQKAEYDERRAAELDSLCHQLCERLLNNSLPPDDAYWWARIAIEEAAAVLVHDITGEPAATTVAAA